MVITEKEQNIIIERAVLGDEEAFGILYQENIKRIYTYIYYRTGNIHDAEDLTARVFQRALNHITKYQRTDVPFSAWLYRIAHNLVANWHRDCDRKKEVNLDECSELRFRDDSLESVIEKNQEVELLLKAIRQMPDNRQTLLILKYVEEMTNQEIGQIMGKSEGAIKSLYHRTLNELRDLLS